MRLNELFYSKPIIPKNFNSGKAVRGHSKPVYSASKLHKKVNIYIENKVPKSQLLLFIY